MATYNRLQYLQLKFQKIREDIELKFEHVRQLVEERKHALFQVLEDIMSEYERKYDEATDAIDLLESHRQQVSDSLDNTLLDGLVSKQIDQLNEKIAALKLDSKEPDVNWKWNENQVNDLITSLGQITSGELNIANDVTIPDYRAKKMPILCAVSRGKQRGEICDPRGVVVHHKSGNIYVSDYGASRVSVFSPSYKFLFQFGAEAGFGKMDAPHGVNIFRDKVYVTQLNTHRLQVYTLDGRCTNRVGACGTRSGEFRGPGDSFFDETNEDVYICDSQNNRVQVFDADLQFKSVFGSNFNNPVRGKIHRNNVIVLDASNPCLHFYFKSGEWFRSILNREFLSIGVRRFFDFELDSDSNVILTDVTLHCVAVSDSRGKIIHQFGSKGEGPGHFDSPWGMALTRDGHIIVVSSNAFGCIRVF